MRPQFIYVLLVFLLLCSCSRLDSPHKPVIKKLTSEVVYGVDSRIDFYNITDEHLKTLALGSVALVDHRKLTENEDPTLLNLQSAEYGATYFLCEDEPFFKQPTAAFCSGFLIGPELIVTAGHCIRNSVNCQNVRFVFGYSYTEMDKDLSTIPKDNVYSCASLIHSETNAISGRDFAIMKTDRPVMQFNPMPLRTQEIVANDAALTAVGYPKGLPGKLAPEGQVRSNTHPNYFIATLDTYKGNSGSAVFNSQSRLVEGILVNGEDDFIYDTDKKCRRSNVCADSACSGETVVRISAVLEYVTPADLQPLPPPFR